MLAARLLLLGGALAMTAVSVPAAFGRDGGVLERRLLGVKEVPAVISAGSGTVRLRIHQDRVEYRLSYRNLEGTPIQAHIHVAQPGVNGGIAAWLCQTPAVTAPPGTPACPSPAGTVTGTITATSLFTPVPAQSVDTFADFLAALRLGVAYANVHTTEVPSGELRADLGGSRHGPHHP